MIKLYSIIKVTVKRPEVFGLFCEYNGNEVLLLIPETSWVASYCSCVQYAQKGDILKVEVIAVDEETKKYSISVRSMYPDPWEDNSFEVGKTYKAKIIRYVTEADRLNDTSGYLVELIPGSFAMLDSEGQTFEENEDCEVIITHKAEEKKALKIKLNKS